VPVVVAVGVAVGVATSTRPPATMRWAVMKLKLVFSSRVIGVTQPRLDTAAVAGPAVEVARQVRGDSRQGQR
jgi:hypothetical protein